MEVLSKRHIVGFASFCSGLQPNGRMRTVTPNYTTGKKQHGPNEIPESKPVHPIMLYLPAGKAIASPGPCVAQMLHKSAFVPEWRNLPMKSALTFVVIGLIGLAFFSGCGDSNSPGQGQGELRVLLVDQPAGYDAVNIIVREVSVHDAGADSSSGWRVVNDSTRTFDLLTLANGASAVLGDTQLAAGHYTQIRLKLASGSTVVVDGVEHPLVVPSGLQTGLKLNHPFVIEANTLYEVTLDFDATRSIHLTGSNEYVLSPVIRVVANQISGTISGVVSPASAKAVVSTIAGADTVTSVADTTSGAFMLMALPAGVYNVHVAPRDIAYSDTTVTGVAVLARQNTDLGTIPLHAR